MLDDGFGHWIAGFTAGEGCFEFRLTKDKKFRPRFSLKLRDDDAPMLFKLATALGCGRVYPEQRDGKNPVAVYAVHDIESLYSIIIPCFERYPLRAKKAREFEVWKAAVTMMFQITRRRKINTRWGWFPRYTKAERAQLAEYGKLLKALKRYKPDRLEGETVRIESPKEVQLPLEPWERD
ncbi:hypothetical protein ES703_125198 [subsurface metagenome]